MHYLKNLFAAVLISNQITVAVASFTQPKEYKNFSSDLVKWNQTQKINLLPHQLKPIDYLENNPDIKGLLIYHQLGTGKTFLSLGFAERNQDRKIVLLVPRFLKSHWEIHLNEYGVKNKKRYQIVTHEDCRQLLTQDLSQTIVIIDESHKIVNKLNAGNSQVAEQYSKLYINLQNSYRILSLTGTPVFKHISDIAYQINLVSGKELLPFNKEKFRQEFMKIKPIKSAIVGQYAQSKISPLMSLFTSNFLSLTLDITLQSMAFVSLGGYFIPMTIESLVRVDETSLRSQNSDLLNKICCKFISFYDFNEQNKKFFPSKTVNIMPVDYNEYQRDFLFRFADEGLETEEIIQLLQDQQSASNDYKSAYIQSTKLQRSMFSEDGAGLEIGNLIYRDLDQGNKIIYPKKFTEALKLMLSTNGPVVVYSQYYYNGLLLFKYFLDQSGQKGKYAVIHPFLTTSKHASIIDQYNKGKIKFLLIHPEITEGISLKGTQQLHLLETPFNKSLQEQIIGRTVRYKSHLHLPANQRHVNIYIWKPEFNKFGLSHNIALRENWARKFPEFNYYGERSSIDRNNLNKNITPDDLAIKKMGELESGLEAIKALLQETSIENSNKSE